MAQPENSDGPKSPERRRFLRGIGAAGAATIATASTGIDFLRPREAAAAQTDLTEAEPAPAGRFGAPANAPVIRRDRAFRHRMQAAIAEKRVPMPPHLSNGDEALYPNRIGNFSKGLPHDDLGEVAPAAYAALVKAAASGKPADFDAIPLGGTVLLVDPQAGLAFDMEGTDSHQLAIPPARCRTFAGTTQVSSKNAFTMVVHAPATVA